MEPWTLDPEIIHLNHGSFGACPTPVLDEQRRWQERMERNPVRFFTEELQPAINRSRRELATFVGADADGLVFVPNATSGINAVLRSLEPALDAASEILITDHSYNACRNVTEVAATRSGAKLIEAPVPFPLHSADAYVHAVLDRVTSATRLVMVDAVTSPTAIVVPVADIVSALEPDVPVLVDAAHGPGMVPLALADVGASFIVGNCHKWMCAPKSSGFLYAREDRRSGLIPATVSHGWNTEPANGASRLHHLFDWTGTDDPSARLAVPAAIGTVGRLHEHGWDGVMKENRDLVRRGRDIICTSLGIDRPAPDDVIGAMATIPLPGGRGDAGLGEMDPLTRILRDRWSIEVPIFPWRDWPQRLLRISAQLYNTEADYQQLAGALAKELR